LPYITQDLLGEQVFCLEHWEIMILILFKISSLGFEICRARAAVCPTGSRAKARSHAT
jgi:hypothetical protein